LLHKDNEVLPAPVNSDESCGLQKMWGSGGRFKICIYHIMFDWAAQGKYARFAIMDTGCEIRDAVFAAEHR